MMSGPIQRRTYIVEGETPVFLSLLISLLIVFVTVVCLWAFPIIPMLKDRLTLETAVMMAPSTRK